MTSDEWVDSLKRLCPLIIGLVSLAFVIATWLQECSRRERPVTVAPSASAVASAPAPSALPPEKGGPVVRDSSPDWADFDKRVDEAARRKSDAFNRCSKEHGVVAMGFGPTVICLNPKMVLFEVDTMYPPFPKRAP